MTDRQLRAMEAHTQALQENTRAIERMLPFLEIIASTKYLDILNEMANETLTSARRMENAAKTVEGATKKMGTAAEQNLEAAKMMKEKTSV